MISRSEIIDTQIESVDIQHQILFDLLKKVAETFVHGVLDENLVSDALQNLIAYANKHFIEEEKLMIKNKVDPRHVSIHRMEHKSFLYDAKSMWDYLCVEEDLAGVSEKLVRFLASWLIFHILGIDRTMANQIFAIQHGATPEQAYEDRHTLKYDAAATHLMLDSVLNLWHLSLERCHKLEEKLALHQKCG